jgi:Ca2+-binding EF-hand superfamily protein
MMLLACLSAIAPVFATRVNFGGLLQPSGKALHLTRPIRPPFRYTPSVSQATTLPVKTRVELTEEVEDAARNIFNTIDANSDGEISRIEMIRAFRRNRDLWERFKLNLWNELKLKTFNSMQSVKDGEFTGDGTVSFEEFSTEFMKTADIDGDGTVSFEEFRTFLSQIDDAEDFAAYSKGTAKSTVSAESVLDSSSSLFELMFMFENIDVDNDGQLTEKELKMASKNSKLFKETMNVKSYRDATKLVEGADTDGDGTVSFDEFKSYLVSSYSKEFLEYLDSGRDVVHSSRENKHASVIVLREVDGDLQVLVRLQSSGSDKPRLSLLGGKKTRR